MVDDDSLFPYQQKIEEYCLVRNTVLRIQQVLQIFLSFRFQPYAPLENRLICETIRSIIRADVQAQVNAGYLGHA